MRNNETGEFELVVGNRQLLVGFFVVVMLFTVAFAMGYVVGENARSARAQNDVAAGAPPAASADPRPQPSSSAASASPAAETPTPASSAPPAAPSNPPAPDTPQPTTQPARETSPPVHDTPPVRETTPVREPPPPKHETAASEAPSPREAKKAVVVPENAAGSYWQVLATYNRDSAQDMVRSLQDKGLPAALSPGPNNVVRVWVGPYSDTPSLGKAKTELEAAGLHPVRPVRSSK
jgi:SPOR domain